VEISSQPQLTSVTVVDVLPLMPLVSDSQVHATSGHSMIHMQMLVQRGTSAAAKLATEFPTVTLDSVFDAVVPPDPFVDSGSLVIGTDDVHACMRRANAAYAIVFM
jgi:hypothetical protein